MFFQNNKEKYELKNKFIYLSNNQENLVRLKFTRKASFESKISELIEIDKELFINEKNISEKYKIIQKSYKKFFKNIEKEVNEFLAVKLFDYLITEYLIDSEMVLDKEEINKNKVNYYFYDTNVQVDFTKYSNLKEYLNNSYDYKNEALYSEEGINNPEKYKLVHHIYGCFYGFIQDYFNSIFISEVKKQDSFSKIPDKNRRYKVVEKVAYSYFEDFLNLKIQDVFCMYKNYIHMSIYDTVVKDIVLNNLDMEKLKNSENSISKFSHILINEIVNSNIRFKSEINEWLVNINTKTRDEDRFSIKMRLKNDIFRSVKDSIPFIIIKRDITNLFENEFPVHKISVLFFNGKFFSTYNKSLVKNIHEKNKSINNDYLKNIYGEFPKKYIDILNNI